jgi:hypothetical protein
MTKTNPFGALAASGGALLAVGLLVLIMVVEPRPAEATFPGQNGRIAYVGYDGNDDEIYKIDHNGGTPVKVTKNETSEDGPSWGSRP